MCALATRCGIHLDVTWHFFFFRSADLKKICAIVHYVNYRVDFLCKWIGCGFHMDFDVEYALNCASKSIMWTYSYQLLWTYSDLQFMAKLSLRCYIWVDLQKVISTQSELTRVYNCKLSLSLVYRRGCEVGIIQHAVSVVLIRYVVENFFQLVILENFPLFKRNLLFPFTPQ